MSKIINLVSVVVFLSSTSVSAGGGGGTAGATEMTQLANNAELVAVLGKEAENLAYTIKQYEGMVKNWEKLPDFIKSNAAGDLAQLAKCRVPWDHIPERSYPLFKARYILERLLSKHGYGVKHT